MTSLHDELVGYGRLNRRAASEDLKRAADTLAANTWPDTVTTKRNRTAIGTVRRVAADLVAPPLPDLTDVTL